MRVFLKIFGVIFGFFMAMFIIIWLMRLNVGKSSFIGISVMYRYFQTIDILSPFNTMIESFTNQINGFNGAISNFSNITDLNSFFIALGQFFPSLFNLLSMPIQVLYYIFGFILVLINEVVRFFQFILNY